MESINQNSGQNGGQNSAVKDHQVDVCIVGGGPAGMLLGLLLAQQNVNTLVLEQHHDFNREYRGEVLMPRFSKLYDQVGLLDYIKTHPHTPLYRTELWGDDHMLYNLQLEDVAPKYPYALWMPQPVLLNALWEKAQPYSQFDLWFDASAQQLLMDGEKVAGVQIKHQGETVNVHAKVTIGADGRGSRIASLAGMKPVYDDYKFDVLWFSLPRPDEGYSDTFRMFIPNSGIFSLIAPKHPDLIQVGVTIPPNSFGDLRNQGIEVVRELLLKAPPVVHEFARGLTDFKPFHPLKAHVLLMKEWARDGLLLVGDSAHTCSPVGGIGVSIASETAAVAAGIVAKAIQKGDTSAHALGEVQRLREKPVREIHMMQRMMAKVLLSPSKITRWFVGEGLHTAGKFHLPPVVPRKLVYGGDEPYPIHLLPRTEPVGDIRPAVGQPVQG